MYSGQTADALVALQKSETSRHSDIAQEAMAVARKSLALSARYAKLEPEAVDLGARTEFRGPAQEVLANADVVEMVKGKLGDELVVAQILSTQSNFDTSTKSHIRLKAAGVSDTVIRAMPGAGRKEPQR